MLFYVIVLSVLFGLFTTIATDGRARSVSYLAARRDRPEVSPGDFEEAIDRALAGLRRKRVMSDRERDIVAVHEAGRAAAELTFQEISTGGHNDLRRASDLARAMVAEYGMSDAIGPVATGSRESAPFLQPTVQQPRVLAEETARETDLEVERLMTDAYAAARSVLDERRASLAEISRRLLDREVVEGGEIRRLLSVQASQGAHAA